MNVGDYVRTENGIDKIEGYRYEPEYENGHVVWFKKSDSGCRFTDENLPKSSPNIIDLIEVGDYVNGKKVAINSKENGGNIVIFTDMDCVNENNIKSILTKEQFESMEYKVGE